MADTPHTLPDDQLDDLLRATAARLDIPPMSDAAALARARIEARAGQTTARERPDNLIPLPADDRPPTVPLDREPERLGREPRSRLRDLALLGGGLAAAAVIAVALAFVFRGFDDPSNVHDRANPIGSQIPAPLAAEPYDIPGFEFVRTVGQPRVPNEPIDVAIGPDGTRYVLDAALGRVVAFTEDGEIRSDWGDEGFSARILETFGASIGIGPAGEIYVSAEQVVVFDATGERVASWPFPVTADDTTRSPRSQGLGVDSQGNVYVAGRGVVWRFEAGTGAASTIALEAETDIQLQSGGDGQLYAASWPGGIYRLSSSGDLELIGRAPGQEDINGFAIAPDGTLVILRGSTSADEPSDVIILDSDGSEIASWPIDRAGFFMGQLGPYWIGVDVTADGTIVLPDPLGHRVAFFDTGGTLVSEIRDEQPDAFGRLLRISVDGAGNVLGYDPSEEPQVLRFASDGELLQAMPFEADLLGAMESLFNASGFAATSEGGFVLAHAHQNRVFVYSPEGERVQEWGGMSFDDPSGLLFPMAAARASNGDLYIVDQSDGDNVKRFTIDGDFLGVVGELRQSQRADIAYHDGSVWAVDGEAVLRFPADGGDPEVVAAADREGVNGALPGFPMTLALDADGNIYTYLIGTGLEQGQFTGHLAKLDPNGNLLWSTELAEAHDRYVDLAIAPDGTLYLADSELRQILVYRLTGEVQTPESTATVEAAPQTIASDLLVVERAADAGGSPQFRIFEPESGDIIDLPVGELVGISSDGGMLLLIDREPGEERLRLDLIAISTETFEELWRTDVGERAESRPNTIYLDTAIARDTAYVAIHDPDYRGEMLEIARVRLSDGFMQWYSAMGLDTDVSELTDPSVEVALLPSPPDSAPEVTSFIRAPEENRTTIQSVLGPGYDHRLRDLVPLQPGDRYLLPGGEGLFNVPHSGYSTDPAIEYVMFNDVTVGEIALPFATLGERGGSFTTYAVANDGRTLYALSLNSSQVAIVDLERLEVEQVVNLSDEPISSLTGDLEWTTLTPFYADHPITSSPDGRYIYCLGNPRDHDDAFTYTPTVWKIDTTTWTIVDDWAPEAPWLAHAVRISDDGSELYVSLSTLAEVDEPDAPFHLTTENHGFAVLSTDALEDQTGYVDLQGYQLVRTLADLYRETYGNNPG